MVLKDESLSEHDSFSLDSDEFGKSMNSDEYKETKANINTVIST